LYLPYIRLVQKIILKVEQNLYKFYNDALCQMLRILKFQV
jgi:hypothetical protein